MVKAIASVARDLGTETVAEFVHRRRHPRAGAQLRHPLCAGLRRRPPCARSPPLGRARSPSLVRTGPRQLGLRSTPLAVGRCRPSWRSPPPRGGQAQRACAYRASACVKSTPTPTRWPERPGPPPSLRSPQCSHRAARYRAEHVRPRAPAGERCRHAQRPHDDRHRAARIARARAGEGAAPRSSSSASRARRASWDAS